MASFVWNRDFDEAYRNPYEDAAQDQFVREARKILSRLCKILEKHNLRFHRHDCSLSKAIWMLHNDSVSALCETLPLLKKGKHELVGRIFRDVWESCQLVEYFLSGSLQSEQDLKKWFNNEVVLHRKIRDQLKKVGRKAEADQRGQRYYELSKFTHRSYRALLKSYSLGRDDMIVCDNYLKFSTAVHTVSLYYTIVGDMIFETLRSMKTSKFISGRQAKEILKCSMEKKAAPQKLAPN
jgi:hypothetical protein